MSNDYKAQVELIHQMLNEAHAHALALRQAVHSEEGESDLHSVLDKYMVPNLQWWMTGNQAGNVKYLNELLERREKAGKK